MSNCLTDTSVPENSDRLSSQFRPNRGRSDAERPLALPIPDPKRGIKPGEITGQRQHRTDHLLGYAGFVTVNVRKRGPLV